MRWVGRVARMRKIKSIQDFGRRTWMKERNWKTWLEQ
jgi:hypothetical protein